MNEEIKEILLIIKSCKQDYDKQKNGMHTFDYGELYLLYNYITNLQQENERLKERIAYLERSNDRREDTILGLRQELYEKEDEDKDIPLIPDDELYIFKGDSRELNYNFKVLKEKINQVVKVINNES